MKGTTPELDRYYQRKQNLLSLLIEIHERMYPMMKYCERLQPVMMGINDQTTVDLMNDIDGLSLIWVPHEPTKQNVHRLEKYFTSKGFSAELLGKKNNFCGAYLQT